MVEIYIIIASVKVETQGLIVLNPLGMPKISNVTMLYIAKSLTSHLTLIAFIGWTYLKMSTLDPLYQIPLVAN